LVRPPLSSEYWAASLPFAALYMKEEPYIIATTSLHQRRPESFLDSLHLLGGSLKMRMSPQRRRTDGTAAEEGAAPEDHGLKWLAKLKSKTMTGRSIRQQAERPPSPPKCQERWYSAYANLRWEKLGGYLKELFPDCEFPHDKVRTADGSRRRISVLIPT